MKKERWTESEILSLPSGEHDYFERKRGAFIRDSGFREKTAKAISAFANSGGGHLVIGVQDDGTIDGVTRIYKGAATTRDWLEQIIPDLVSYPLQDFRVHEVEPDESSSIPADHVVMVIDIGDSMQAPHQSAFTKTYYYRAGGRSEPAQHHFLEMLRGREGYPSRRIAHTWLNFVIRPFLDRLEPERERLNNLTLFWDYRTHELGGVSCFYMREGALSPNKMQFLEFYPEIKAEIEDHDKLVNELVYQVVQLATSIQLSDTFREVHARSMSEESLTRIRRAIAARADYPNRDQLLESLFGTMSDTEQKKLLSQHILNAQGELDDSKIVAPLWNLMRSEFMTVMRDPLVIDQNKFTEKAQRSLYENVTNLIGVLERTRNDLARKHGEVWEDETLARISEFDRF